MDEIFEFFEDTHTTYHIDDEFKEEYKKYLTESELSHSRDSFLSFLLNEWYVPDLVYDEESNGFDIDMNKLNEWLND